MKLCTICQGDGSTYKLEDGRDAHLTCYVRMYDYINDEDGNRIFEGLLAEYGAHALEEKLRLLPGKVGPNGKRQLNSYKSYNRRWPWDAKQPIGKLEDVQDFMPSPAMDPQEELIMAESKNLYLASLTPKQRHVVEERENGYKPKEIAERLGHVGGSGKVRWHLWAARQKFEEVKAKLRGE